MIYPSDMAKVITLEGARAKRYGAWGGKAKGRSYVEGKCAASVPHGYSFRQCSRKNGQGENGLFCKQHDVKYVLATEATIDAVNASQSEPIAYLYHDATDVRKVDQLIHSTMLSFNKLNGLKNETKLYLAPPQVNEALERAAKICETCANQAHTIGNAEEFRDCAARVRALKG